MPTKQHKPTSPGLRQRVSPSFEEITKQEPEKSLLLALRRHSGRNNQGRVTVWGKGGGSKRYYRIIDYRRNKLDIPGKVLHIEYDPNRTCRIALLLYKDGERRYILAPSGLKVGDEVVSSPNADIKPGNALPLRSIPAGTPIHNVELKKGKGGQLVRSAGAAAQLLVKVDPYAHVKLPSGEVRLIHLDCMATVGQVGNIEHATESIGKAGGNVHKGLRPKVRGVAMNPVDHPLGGGEGKSSGGRHPVTPWGKPTKGYKTRKRKDTEKFILKHRE
jgi:large subunit ribosomal protein L2